MEETLNTIFSYRREVGKISVHKVRIFLVSNTTKTKNLSSETACTVIGLKVVYMPVLLDIVGAAHFRREANSDLQPQKRQNFI